MSAVRSRSYAAGENVEFDFNFTDSGDRDRVTLDNGVPNYRS